MADNEEVDKPVVDTTLIKAALEEAKFDDVELREKIYECINELQADLEDAEYQPSVKVLAVFDELEQMLADIEEREAEEKDDEDDDVDPSSDDDDEEEEEDEDEDDEDEDEDDDDDVPDELKNL